MNIIETIKTFIITELLNEQPGFALEDHDDLLMSGLIDSLGVMRLVAFIDETYGYDIPPEELTIENFMNVAVIADYLNGQLAPNSAG